MISIKPMTVVHWPQVSAIYLEGIRTGHATFQQSVPEWNEWDAGHLQHSRLVAVEEKTVAGWAALTPVSGRCVYAGVAEISIYVGEQHRGKKIGARLLNALITESERNNIWTLQAGIFPENERSLQLHTKNGFRVIGRRERIGELHGVWRDTILLERRSNVAGK